MPNSQKKLAITVSADECNTAYETIISKLARTADVPGFRKGKAPPQMVLNHFGKKSITAQACEQIIGSAVPAALQQKNIRAIGQAQMADDEAIGKMIDNFAPGQDIKFEVLVDIWPEASLKGAYKGLTVSCWRPAKVYPASLGDSVDEIKREGAVCVVDLIGYKKNADGSKVKNSGSQGDRLPDLAIGENVEVVMEKGKFFEGFVESIDGMQAGDQASVPVTFPTNHKVAELRGMEAIFDVTIKGLKDMMYPALDDDFAKKIPNCDSVVALKKRIRESITEESLISTGKNVDKALENAIVDLVDVEIPETLVDEQTKTKFASMMSDFKAKGMDDEQIKSMITKENYDRYKSTSRDNTVRSLRISFVIGEL
uniref:peptidylprolyl isomerase n=1 Tax=Guillardia theta (strain CCMP2712) TaxID=905079 RepID=A0A0C3TCA4_GUITC